jgi:WD40 repeat protein
LAVVLVCLFSTRTVVLRADAEPLTLPLTRSFELGAEAQNVVFSPDGCFLLATVRTEGREHVARVDARTWTVTELPLAASDCYPLCLSPDGRLLIYGFRGVVHVVDTETYRDVLLLPAKPRAYSFSPDGALLASVDQTDRLTIWEVGTWREVRSLQLPCAYGDVRTLTFASGGSTLVTFGKTRIATWTLSSRNATSCLEYSGPASLAQLMPDGKHLALCGDDGTMRVVDLTDGKQIASVAFSFFIPSCLRFAPNAQAILSMDSSQPGIWIRSVLSGAPIAVLEGAPSDVRSAAFCPAGNYVVSVGATGRVCVWDVSALNLHHGSSFEITTVDWQDGSVTIKNRAANPLDLLGWTITDGELSHTFRSSLWVRGGESYIIYPNLVGAADSQRGLRIDGADMQVSLLAPAVFGGSAESTKRH